MTDAFEVVCEIEPPTRPDFTGVRRQIEELSSIASAFLIPDNHLGRATISSVALAHEVATLGGRSIACLNARDRNLLGLRRDLLTAAAYGVREFLFVYGDRPREGARTGELTVARMLEEVRDFGPRLAPAGVPGAAVLRTGVTAGMGRPLAGFKADADFLFVQVSFDLERLLRWRDALDFQGPVYAGVIVLPSLGMARRLDDTVDDIEIPEHWFDRIAEDGDAGVDLACEYLMAVRESGAFDGAHLVPVARSRQVAARLEADFSRSVPGSRAER